MKFASMGFNLILVLDIQLSKEQLKEKFPNIDIIQIPIYYELSVLNSDESGEELSEKLTTEFIKDLDVRILLVGTTVQENLLKESKFHKQPLEDVLGSTNLNITSTLFFTRYFLLRWVNFKTDKECVVIYDSNSSEIMAKKKKQSKKVAQIQANQTYKDIFFQSV